MLSSLTIHSCFQAVERVFQEAVNYRSKPPDCKVSMQSATPVTQFSLAADCELWACFLARRVQQMNDWTSGCTTNSIDSRHRNRIVVAVTAAVAQQASGNSNSNNSSSSRNSRSVSSSIVRRAAAAATAAAAVAAIVEVDIVVVVVVVAAAATVIK